MIATGTYTGDGTENRTIPTGLTSAIKFVSIVSTSNGDFWKSSDMAGDQHFSRGNGGAGQMPSGPPGISFSGSNFTVDASAGPSPNQNLDTYFWVAFSV